MALLPDKGKLIFYEQNVDITQGGAKPNDAYDLRLYEESGTKGTRAVLEVTIILVFDFVDTGSTPGLTWTASEERKFMDDVKTECATAWGEKHQLVTKNPTPPAKVAGVTFNIETRDGGSGHSHWNVKCRKVDSPRMSYTKPGGGSAVSNGETEWDSMDLTAETKKGATTSQRGAIHEFGHLLGYRDEYTDPTASPKDLALLFNPSHPTETDSIMYWGEKVYPRHYVLFADWISLQWINKDNKNCKGHDWKVNGTIDMLNAQL